MIDFRSPTNPEPSSLKECPIIQDWAEFAKEPINDVVAKIQNYHTLNQEEFRELGDNFYEKSQTYIYDILSGNAAIEGRTNLINRFIPNGIGRIIDHPGKSFVDFGGGVGAVCEIVAKASTKQITYIDIPSRMTDFAEWRFAKHGLGVNFIRIPENDFTLPEQYDVIFTDAVWEHLPPEKQLTYLDRLILYLRTHGLFYFLVDLSGHSEVMPMHFNVDIVALHERLRHLGLQCIYGRNNFASVWEKVVVFSTFEDFE